jgi:hypothetical protein
MNRHLAGAAVAALLIGGAFLVEPDLRLWWRREPDRMSLFEAACAPALKTLPPDAEIGLISDDKRTSHWLAAATYVFAPRMLGGEHDLSLAVLENPDSYLDAHGLRVVQQIAFKLYLVAKK